MAEKLTAAIHRSGVRKLSVNERQTMEEQLRDLQEQLRSSEGAGGVGLNDPSKLQAAGELKEQVRRLEDVLTKDQDLEAKGHERAHLDARRKELEAIIKKHQLSAREEALRNREGFQQDFEKAVQKRIYFEKNISDYVREWQEIKRRFE